MTFMSVIEFGAVSFLDRYIDRKRPKKNVSNRNISGSNKSIHESNDQQISIVDTNKKS